MGLVQLVEDYFGDGAQGSLSGGSSIDEEEMHHPSSGCSPAPSAPAPLTLEASHVSSVSEDDLLAVEQDVQQAIDVGEVSALRCAKRHAACPYARLVR